MSSRTRKSQPSRLTRYIVDPPPPPPPPASNPNPNDSLSSFQIDVAVNAPEAGTIKEFLANEEDTVTVGQDLLKLELGGAPEGGKKEEASSEPKDAAPSEQPTSSQPEGGKEKEASTEQSKPEPPKQESKPEPKKDDKPAPPKQDKKPEPKKDDKPAQSSPFGSREERRVRAIPNPLPSSHSCQKGKDEKTLKPPTANTHAKHRSR